MKHLSLFSGIGGFDLAATWLGWENVAFVEYNEFCYNQLCKRFPNSIPNKNIKDFDGTEYTGVVDVVSGGFPCQPFSSNGQRKGANDDRFLWPEMCRVVREIRPNWVICENVAGLQSMPMEFSKVIHDLEKTGYSVRTFDIPAAAVGSPTIRRRTWICAHANVRRSQTQPLSAISREQKARKVSESPWFSNSTRPSDWGKYRSELLRNATRLSKRMDVGGHRLKALGNSICPHIAYNIFLSIQHVEDVLKTR